MPQELAPLNQPSHYPSVLVKRRYPFLVLSCSLYPVALIPNSGGSPESSTQRIGPSTDFYMLTSLQPAMSVSPTTAMREARWSSPKPTTLVTFILLNPPLAVLAQNSSRYSRPVPKQPRYCQRIQSHGVKIHQRSFAVSTKPTWILKRLYFIFEFYFAGIHCDLTTSSPSKLRLPIL